MSLTLGPPELRRSKCQADIAAEGATKPNPLDPRTLSCSTLCCGGWCSLIDVVKLREAIRADVVVRQAYRGKLGNSLIVLASKPTPSSPSC